MKKEKISIRRKETSIKLQASQINSIRIKDIEKNAIRVYQDGKIGISGIVGTSLEEELTKQAIDNLSSNISYSNKLESNKKDHRNYTEIHYSENDLIQLITKVLDSLNREFSDFIFSESTKTIEIDYKFQNTDGLDLRYQDEYLELGFIVKARSSPNLYDTFISWKGRNLDLDRFLSFTKKQLQAERNKVALPSEDKVPVFFLSQDSLRQFLIRQLNGETYGNKASLFNGKIGKKLFNNKLNILQNKNPKTTYSVFFDTQGVTKENDSVTLVENGVLKHVFTDKETSKKFNLKHTGSANGGYDDVPKLGFTNIQTIVDSHDIQKTLNNKKAILVIIAAGGEFNSDGNYSTPVQASYLFDGKNLLGKLPDFSMNNNIYNMLGKDYIGTFNSKYLYFGEYHFILGCYMNIKN